MKSLLLSTFIFWATFSFAGNDLKSNIEATITEINTNSAIAQKDKDKFVARFNILANKLNKNNTKETQNEILEEYNRLTQDFKKTTGVSLSSASKE